MALTTAQQVEFSTLAAQWLRDQHAAGNTRAEYQLWKSTAAQVKAALAPYLAALRAQRVNDQSTATTLRAAQDTAWQAEIDALDAITGDPNP